MQCRYRDKASSRVSFTSLCAISTVQCLQHYRLRELVCRLCVFCTVLIAVCLISVVIEPPSLKCIALAADGEKASTEDILSVITETYRKELERVESAAGSKQPKIAGMMEEARAELSRGGELTEQAASGAHRLQILELWSKSALAQLEAEATQKRRRDGFMYAISIMLIVSAFGSLFLVLSVLRKGPGYTMRDVVNVAGLVLIIFAIILVVVIADTEQQLATAVGVLGTIAGYLFGTLRTGRDSKRLKKNGAKPEEAICAQEESAPSTK